MSIKWCSLLSFILLLVSASLYFSSSIYWYYPACIGLWTLFSLITFSIKKTSTLQLFIKKRPLFILLYVALFIWGVLTEVIGRGIFHLWIYPNLPNVIANGIIFVFYPFILLSFLETYHVTSSLIGKYFGFISGLLICMIIWEGLNMNLKTWVYIVPNVPLEVFHLNILIICLWPTLLIGPIFIYNLVNRRK